jgi:RNA polymerase sigma-70 factor (ECF subfamily)
MQIGLRRAGREQAARRRRFEQLAREYERDVFSAALRMTGNYADAQDVAQDALVKAYLGFDQFELGTNFRAWMLRIVTNTYINEFRRRRRTPEMMPWETVTAETAGKVVAEAGEPLPEEQALADSLEAEIEEALARLPEVFREAVLLCDLHGLSYREIADALKVPIGTVRSRIARGRALLQEQLKQYARSRGLI